ncbi:phytanoyl-CoA dioxygenase family protein [Undibacterium sp.]|uniref:phytanoyl-CoA dioxygenase family protein n=1 Tax=Undibacterium sp. TaxID=1914977 RepID=UPI00375078A4
MYPERYQGLLYLTDCNEVDGAFHCVLGFLHRLPYWLDNLKTDDEPRHLAAQALQAKAVPGNAGDFIIWHQALPHCATPNRGSALRMLQYLTYIPSNDVEHSVWR